MKERGVKCNLIFDVRAAVGGEGDVFFFFKTTRNHWSISVQRKQNLTQEMQDSVLTVSNAFFF